ncbi:hypothetical protein F4813DRAFT_216893 [Daldinia decipiens]|uniref:uncharacterized protein n=1 Tax=Daldinia decipiens TaxID=326647 RepID=UPI0020C463DC|nr:uncharacterized protein F4813DRAFT_216893 [Daldinia decipiens]KAI1654218.1 hypothetical protein F4813DRAFT_216893 [Daldinia decipiens]
MKLPSLIAATTLAALPLSVSVTHRRQGSSCVSGSFQCFNPVNGSSQVLACINSYWVLSSICEPGTQCASTSSGGCICQPI